MNVYDLMNTTQVGDLLAELTGNEKWDRRKVAMYRKRGTKGFPQPDAVIGNAPYWYRDTIEKYARTEEKK